MLGDWFVKTPLRFQLPPVLDLPLYNLKRTDDSNVLINLFKVVIVLTVLKRADSSDRDAGKFKSILDNYRVNQLTFEDQMEMSKRHVLQLSQEEINSF